MTLSLYAASSDWTEAGINAVNAPAKEALLATFSGIVQAGQVLVLPLSGHIGAPGIYSFILEAAPENGNVGLGSKENPAPASRPQLEITTVGNSPPVFSPSALSTPVNQPLTVTYMELLAGAYDPDGDPVSLVLVNGGTSAGGSVTMGANDLTYTPSIDYSGPDSFVLTVQDGRGTFTSATVSMQVISPVDEAFKRVPTVSREAGDVVRIRFEGIPQFDHLIQRSINLKDWTTLATVNGSTTGMIDHIDPSPPEEAAFYRVATP